MRTVTLKYSTVIDAVMAADGLAASLDCDDSRHVRIVGDDNIPALERLMPIAAAFVSSCFSPDATLTRYTDDTVTFTVSDNSPMHADVLLEAAVGWQLLALCHVSDKERHERCVRTVRSMAEEFAECCAGGEARVTSIIPRWW